MKNTALITGASSGIGMELARFHAQHGGDLILIARSEDKLNNLKEELEQKYEIEARIIAIDLTLHNAPDEIHEQVTDWGVEVDVLINNAGFGGQGLFHERDWEQDLSMIQLNIIALTALTRFFLPDMVDRNHGKILNVSSTASLMPGPLQAVYFATKAYVTSFSNALSEELRSTQVTVTNLMPGATETGFAKTSDMEDTDLFKSAVSAETVARDGYEAMLKGKMDVISGVPFMQRIMLSTIPLAPKKITLSQVRKLQEK